MKDLYMGGIVFESDHFFILWLFAFILSQGVGLYTKAKPPKHLHEYIG